MGKGKKPGRASSTLRTLFFFVAFVIAVISAQTWWEVRQDRQLTIDSEMNSSMVAVRSIEEHAERILADIDRMLNSASTSIQVADQHILEDDVGLYQLLANEKQILPSVQALRFVDLTGVSRASSARVGATEIELSDLQLRQVDANPAKPDYFVGPLVKSTSARELILPVARNLYIRGQHVGMVVADLKVSYFFDFYKRITNYQAIVSLRKLDGSLMIRSPFEPAWVDKSLRDAKSMIAIRSGANEGAFTEYSALTGEYLLFTYKKIPDASMVAVYARNMNDVLAPWKSRTLNRILLSIGISGFIVLALIAFLIYYNYKQKRDDALTESEHRYRQLYDEGNDPIVLISQDMLYIDCNAAALRFFGVPDKQRIIGKKVGLFSRQSAQQLQQPDIIALIEKAIAGEPQQFEWVTIRRHKIIYTDVTINRTELDKGYAIFAILRDISARKRAELLQTTQNRILHLVMADAELEDILKEIVCFADSQIPQSICSILMLNDDGSYFSAIFTSRLSERTHAGYLSMPVAHGNGASSEAVITRKSHVVGDILTDPTMENARQYINLEEYPSCGSWPIIGKEGQVMGVFSALLKEHGLPSNEYLHLAGVVADLASVAIESRKAEERIRHLAHYDELTGLPNRFLCTQHIGNAIAHAEHRGGQVAVFLMDLDRFKNINDTFGHETGEALLREIALRFRHCLRELDILARVGGDEFIVLVDDYEDPLQLGEIAQKLLTEARKPFDISGHECQLSTSIGIATYPTDGGNAQALIKNADIAMYRAKHKGKDDYRFYSDEVNTHTIERIALETELRRAIERQEFVVHYQPKVDLKSSRIVGAEALVRWQHPVRGLLPPGEFIGLAEEAGLIDQIGLQVLDRACADIDLLDKLGLAFGRIAINLAGSQFNDDNLLADIQRVVQARGVSSSSLEFEITESMVMHNREQAIAIMDGIRALGFTISIDDFGTGYSSLAYLKRFPVDNVKIDKSFITDIPHDANGSAIVQAIIAMAHALNLKVVTEGVETEVQLQALQVFGSDEYQGYFFSRPIPHAAFVQMLQEHAQAQI
ncbi:PAS domain S-box/diguanylate cyclase (GGDEF) domain-containing protein [Herbaspirillum sp. CF444]|uniref:EAL domain-containing protein n=1 Tax=Herbaspirillum sp. CF444 TaxID=1144319 RepID=UPI000272457E|nr:PAS domain S-box/diguanylate cyclase (GGDEF) domain-containing protein [Herbaspirillum sp. CF444]